MLTRGIANGLRLSSTPSGAQPLRHVAPAVQLPVRARVEERALRRVVARRIEVAAEVVQLAVVRPVAGAHAELEREVRTQLPAVLRERVDVPVPPLALGGCACPGRLARRPVSMSATALPVPPGSTGSENTM